MQVTSVFLEQVFCCFLNNIYSLFPICLGLNSKVTGHTSYLKYQPWFNSSFNYYAKRQTFKEMTPSCLGSDYITGVR